MTTFGKDFWIGCLRQLTYVSERDEARLRDMTEDQLRLIEELLHRQAVKLAKREPMPLPRSRPHENDKERAGRERAEEDRFDYLKDEGLLRRR